MAEQVPLPLGFSPRLGTREFVVSDANRDAAAWLANPDAWPGPRTLLIGPEGSGKSHLAGLFDGRVFDDADRVEAETLFHAWNAATRDMPLLLTSRLLPSQWNHGLPDLASRLAATPLLRLGEPDDALLMGVLAKQFADRGVRVADDVLVWLAARMERSFAAAADIVGRLDARALAERRAITVPLAREVLEGQLALAI